MKLCIPHINIIIATVSDLKLNAMWEFNDCFRLGIDIKTNDFYLISEFFCTEGNNSTFPLGDEANAIEC